MPDNIIVSVIIPCYNQSIYLSETVNSVLSSDYSPLEIIIVNDGSSDDTHKIGQYLADLHPQITYLSQPNGGPSVARNNGIRRAKGKYILPLDGDDLISTNYIASAVEVLKSRPEVKVVYCQAEKFGAKSGPWKLKPFSLKNLALDNMIFVSGLYRKSDWESIGGYAEEMTWGYEDWEFWISMLKDGGDVVQLPLVGFFYRTSLTSRRKSVKREGKRKTIAFLNTKHREFIYKYLKGPLRQSRTHSKKINMFLRLFKKF
jgi:glycosyltransferase involved in cell wall biosynthesis